MIITWLNTRKNVVGKYSLSTNIHQNGDNKLKNIYLMSQTCDNQTGGETKLLFNISYVPNMYKIFIFFQVETKLYYTHIYN